MCPESTTEARHTVTVQVEVEVIVRDPDVIERFTGPEGDEVRAASYPLFTEADVLEHLAGNAVMNGVENATMLDGFADLPAEAVSMRLEIADAEVL